MGLPLPQSNPFPALPQQKSTIYNSQQHMHEDLELKKEILAKSKDGIDMNLLAFRVPYHT